MQCNWLSKACSSGCALALLAVFALSGGVLARTMGHQVASGEVRAVCRLSPGGSFEARSSAVEGALSWGARPGELEGELTLDLRTLRTGIGLRDKHLREYLEVDQPGNELAVISDVKVGSIGAEGFTSGWYRFRARLRLHGRAQDVEGRVEIRTSESRLQARAEFPVRLSDFAIERPAYLGIGVKDDLALHVTLMALPFQTQSASARPTR